MPIQIAFSTVACPQWTLEQVVDQAKSMGYAGVELRTLGAGGTALAADPALSDPRKVHDLFAAAGIVPSCLSTSLVVSCQDDPAGRQAHWETVRALETAAKIGCPAVRVFACDVEPGRNRNAVLQGLARQLRPLADKAGELGVTLLLENAGSLNNAKEWWWLFNILEHPMIGLAWNIANSVAGNREDIGGSLSVPVLNSRIRVAKVKDTKIGEGSGFVPLGEGTVGIPQFIRRLMGIGFDGVISVENDHLWLPALPAPEEYLPDAYQRLRGWLDAAAKAKEDAKPKPKAVKT